ncbi:MAG: hypothetical protein Q9222_004081 [Ikaeria aurantiellina]
MSKDLGTEADTLSTIEDDTRPQDESITGSSSNEGTLFADDLIKRCTGLLKELEAFQEHLVKCKRNRSVEVKPFRNSVASELKTLEKLRSLDPEADRTIHTLRSSNLPFYSAVWDTAKGCSSLVAFTKRFYWDVRPTRSTKRSQLPKKNCALVDIVAQDGQQWIKVSTVTETRLLFELAKAGWEGADSASDDGSDQDGVLVNGLAHISLDDDDDPSTKGHLQTNSNSRDDDDGDDRVEIVRQAHDLQKAALAHKVHYIHPSVTVILPKISPNPPPEITNIIDTIRSTGATVQVGPSNPPADLDTAFQNLVLDPFTSLTPTLNIDCTILLALVSDLSHSATTPEPWFHEAISRQLELEEREQLLPSTLWPAMAGKDLVCTEEAARRMLEIVETIGTASERQRTKLLLASLGQPIEQGPEGLRVAFTALSNYAVPNDWNLPIRVVRSDLDISTLPPVAKQVKDSLTAINQSVFLYGWASGWTTMSSNRTVVRQIEEIVEAGEGEQVGPSVWLCGTARSLVGKEKARRDGAKGTKEEE